ncbi:hypothetical protein KI387_017173, partial [Taxus chinensis]
WIHCPQTLAEAVEKAYIVEETQGKTQRLETESGAIFSSYRIADQGGQLLLLMVVNILRSHLSDHNSSNISPTHLLGLLRELIHRE